jgi:MFS superfamily sulfate permease-like transporter
MKDINIAVLSTCGLLLTLMLGFVVPSLKTSNRATVTRVAAFSFLLASAFAALNLYDIGKSKPKIPSDAKFAIMVLVLLAGIVCLAVGVSNILH